MKILLNNSEYNFKTSELPCLIHGEEGSGASLFSISLMANFFEQNEKILFICAFPHAKEEMEKQTNVIGGVNIIYITGQEEPQISKIIDTISDIDERVILLKNIETFPTSVFEKLKSHKNLVLSGDLNKCEFKEEILKLDFKTKIMFSDSDVELQKYEGYLSGEQTGIVKLR